ncbi:FtsK/SpoIIIE domain-containing protein [Microbacterium hydrocarbonoxydans]|uniref:FtsK/SpoIIIE domain-containing protein n=1 Tax=Microbacterium hydrocarbonoxydans TaxID=273678 RepID=UPI0007BB8D09|nr:FtsK/SpoIIIE domain-containing protein [Microbacterium hydrocarbonoxydans]GAT72786.1 cell division FtsK/SpoIIIE [Microbacterium sp. HM58-2]
MDSPSIALPADPAPPRRPPVPFVAALVPVAAGIVLWLVTGSLYALCFAALGPLMIAASLVDAARSRRRARRDDQAESEAAWARAEGQLARYQAEERERRWHRHPDAAAALAEPPLRGSQSPDAHTELVVGRGEVPSGIRANGEGDRAGAFKERCARLDDAPVIVPLGGGVCLRGPAPTARAAARALVLQLCLRFGAGQLALVGDRAADWSLGELPHARAARRGAFRLGLAMRGDSRPSADAVVWIVDAADEVPEGVTTVLELAEPGRAGLRTPHGMLTLAAECVSAAQATAVAGSWAASGEELDVLPDLVALSDLSQPPSRHGLPAAIGRSLLGDVVVDIVDDGPHAIVTGTTGTGKSELLVSWVTAIASAHGPDRVTFVLADFKGGTAFDPLRGLPQVAAVITDLDDAGARRGVTSLTAELRRREAVLAAAGVRDVQDARLPRLVIVVDEFAALLQEHPDLGAVFTDIAARGRALGMHLIIGTQRASGVIREALAANCPLRVSLRVGDPADSRLVIGTDAASEIPGGSASRGLALVRRPQDAEPIATRVALTGAGDLRAIGLRQAPAEPPPSPWLPALPTMLPLAEIDADVPAGRIVIGRTDEPERQRQPLALLDVGVDRGIAVLGAPGSGRTSVLRLLRAQCPDSLWVPHDAEAAWDAVVSLSGRRGSEPRLVLCDDLDAQLADLPAEHAQQLAQRWEQILRGHQGTTFVFTAARATGPVGRLLDALPRRVLMRMPSRVEHLAAGGDSATFDRARPPGRAIIGEHEAQLAWVAAETTAAVDEPDRRRDHWSPRAPLAGVVSAAASAVIPLLAAARPECDVRHVSADAVPAVGDGVPTILVGEAESWQRQWSLWQRVRAEGEILVRAENPADLRQLAGVRELPPYAHPHAGRAWSLFGAEGPRRVVLPELDPR